LAREGFDAASATELGGNLAVREYYEYLQSGSAGFPYARIEALKLVIGGMRRGRYQLLKRFLLRDADLVSPFSDLLPDVLLGGVWGNRRILIRRLEISDKLRRIADLIPSTGEPFKMPEPEI